ncbi:MAG: Ig-like domain-containing protein, partial [Actinomycetota bacterium]
GGDVTAELDDGDVTVANWADPISAGPGETGDVTFTVTNDNPTLFAAGGQPDIDASGTLTFTVEGSTAGQAEVSVIAEDDGAAASSAQTFIITITLPNQPPTFDIGDNELVDEDADPITRTGWADNIMPGPLGETGTVTFDLVADDTSLFTVGGQPALSPDGTLTYTPAADANGTTDVTVTAVDDKGAESAPQTFTIAISAVNDRPSFAIGPDVTVETDDPAQSITGWAQDIFAGADNESDQVLTFYVATSDDSLFATDGTPQISPPAP